jgi:hypothetical protein
VSPFPINLRMIAGDATAVEVPQITQIYRYPTRGGEDFSLASGGQSRHTRTS